MNENTSGRRRFLRSTAASVIGIAGVTAATGTAAADHNVQSSGDVTVLSVSNSWSYQVATNRPYGHKDPVEKRSKADSGDEVLTGGAIVDGHVLEGGEDTYWFPDVITRIYASPDGGDSYLEVNVGSTEYGRYIRMDAYGSHFDYTFSYEGLDGNYSDVSKGAAAEGNDTVSGDWASGSVDAGWSDNYSVVGYLDYMIISDPYSSGSTGWEVRFNPD